MASRARLRSAVLGLAVALAATAAGAPVAAANDDAAKTVRLDRVYCCDACRQRAYRVRKGAR